MHYGTVNDAVEAGVTLTILGDNGTTEHINFVIDTGLTEETTLPQEVISRLNLTLANDGDDFENTLADGTTTAPMIYTVRILWHDRLREIEVVNMETDPLIGMKLLRGSNLSVDAVPGGQVTITELPPTSQTETLS